MPRGDQGQIVAKVAHVRLVSINHDEIGAAVRIDIINGCELRIGPEILFQIQGAVAAVNADAPVAGRFLVGDEIRAIVRVQVPDEVCRSAPIAEALLALSEVSKAIR
jgi:hypothetical protein